MGSRRTHFTRRLPASVPKPSPRRKPLPKSKLTPHRAPELYRRLVEMVSRLEVLYSTCVTVELALKQQSGDRDQDIAGCLKRNVTELLGEQAQALQAISQGLAPRTAARPSVRS